MPAKSRVELQNCILSNGSVSNDAQIVWTLPIGKLPIFTGVELAKLMKNGGIL